MANGDLKFRISGGSSDDPFVREDGGLAADFVTSRAGGPGVLKGTSGDTSGAVGGVSDTDSTLTLADGRLHSFRNGGSEKAYIDLYGELHNGGAWDDVMGPVATAGGIAAVTTEAWSNTNPYVATFMRHDQDDTLFWTLQLPHRWNRGEVRFHVHIVPMVSPATPQVIRFDGSYTWAHPGTALPDTWTSFTAVSHTVGTSDGLKPTIVPLFVTAPESAWESDILMVRVRRPGSSDAADTYETGKSAVGGLTSAANVCILSADLHFQASKAGTHSEIPT